MPRRKERNEDKMGPEQRIVEWMERYGVSGADFARATGMDASEVSRFKVGERPISVSRLRMVHNFINTRTPASWDWLMSITDGWIDPNDKAKIDPEKDLTEQEWNLIRWSRDLGFDEARRRLLGYATPPRVEERWSGDDGSESNRDRPRRKVQ